MKMLYPLGPHDGCFGLILGMRSLRDPLTFLVEMARRYGDIAYFRAGPLHSYLVSHPDLIREVELAPGQENLLLQLKVSLRP